MNTEEKKQAIEKLEGLSSTDRRLVEESTGLTIEEMVSDIEQGGEKKGLIYYSSLVAASAGYYGATLLVVSSIAAPFVLSIGAVAGIVALTGHAAKKFSEEHPPNK